MNLEEQKQTKWIKIYQSEQTDVTFWACWSELLFPERSAWWLTAAKNVTVDMSQSSRVIDRRSNSFNLYELFRSPSLSLSCSI